MTTGQHDHGAGAFATAITKNLLSHWTVDAPSSQCYKIREAASPRPGANGLSY